MAPKSFVRLREVVYTLSPFEVEIMNGLFKDIPAKFNKLWHHSLRDMLLYTVVPTVGTIYAANAYVANEEAHHRY